MKRRYTNNSVRAPPLALKPYTVRLYTGFFSLLTRYSRTPYSLRLTAFTVRDAPYRTKSKPLFTSAWRPAQLLHADSHDPPNGQPGDSDAAS